MWFSWIVRDDHQSPPLQCLSGLPYFLLSITLMQYGHLILFDKDHGIWDGLVVYLLISVGVVLLDGRISNSFGKNIKTLRANGFTDTTIVLTMLYNLITTQLLSWFVFHHLCDGISSTLVVSWIHRIMAQRTFLSLHHIGIVSPTVLFRVLVNLASTEYLFYKAHKWLHETWPHFHIMHHCCTHPSNSTNLIFHPLDMAFEFGGPGIVLLLFHFTIWNQDQVTLMLSYSIVQTYYAIDHSEYVKTFHYSHHTHIDAIYTIYVKHRSNPKLDQVRQRVMKSK